MVLTPLHDPNCGILSLAIFLSGTGSNARKMVETGLLEEKSSKPLYLVVAIFSDKKSSAAIKISRDYSIPVIVNDIDDFYRQKNKPKRDLNTRMEYDQNTVSSLAPYNPHLIVYAGYMSIVTQPLINAYLGINLHPADLTREKEGKRLYTGAHAVRDALLAWEKRLRSTTHLLTHEVDAGPILFVSNPIDVQLPEQFDATNKK